MLRLLSKTKKTFAIGWSTTLKAAGILDSVEDPDYLARASTLDRLRHESLSLQQSIVDYCGHVQMAAQSSEVLDNSLRDPHDRCSRILGITHFHVNAQLLEACVKPLQALIDRIDRVGQIQTKRFRNHELLQTATGQERARIEAKYQQYHAAFVNAVDALEALAQPLYAHVWQCEAFFFQEFLRAARENVENTYPIFVPLAAEEGDSEDVPRPAMAGIVGDRLMHAPDDPDAMPPAPA
jgi:hypothetical protein